MLGLRWVVCARDCAGATGKGAGAMSPATRSLAPRERLRAACHAMRPTHRLRTWAGLKHVDL